MSWLTDIEPELLRASVTVATAALASLTALLIAFVAYPWQRALDRETQLQSDLRKMHGEFLSLFEKAQILALDQDFDDDHEIAIKLRAAVGYFELFAEVKVAAAASDLAENVRTLQFVMGAAPEELTSEEWNKARAENFSELTRHTKEYVEAVRGSSVAQLQLLSKAVRERYQGKIA